jgi:hypothetical protein
MDKTCFVIQPFDGDFYDRLFDEVFAPAILAAGLKPYRVDQDPSSVIPIQTIEQGIKAAAVCFAEISTDNPNVWFELGYSLALGKSLCMVSHERSKYPFDVQHRRIVTYKRQATPSEFDNLQEKITATLKARLAEQDACESNTEAVQALSAMPETEGLKPHELLALTIVMQNHFSDGIIAWQLQKQVEKGGFVAPAGSLAIIGLKRKDLIAFDGRQDGNGEYYEGIFVSEKGEDWLMKNQEKLNLKLPEEEPDRARLSVEIKDEDIPF